MLSKKKNNTTELGKLISEKREQIGISQRELARQAKIDPAEVSRIESGKRLKPNILYLKGIAETLNLSMVDLMKLAGYDEIEINWGKDLTNKRSTADYQRQIKNYEKFYFDVLEDIEQRRKNAFACKGVVADLIDKIELSKTNNSNITIDDVYDDLKELLTMIRPNLEKLDKSKYPSVDFGVFPKKEIRESANYVELATGKIKEK